jgi:hypothetical protein
MREWVTTVLEVVGLGLIVAGCATLAVWLGLIVAGGAMVGLGYLWGQR